MCFEHVLGRFFREFLAQLAMEGRVFENFQKNQKNFKIPKILKIVPKSVEKCFRMIFSKKIYAQCSMEGRVFENFQKKIIQKSKKAENCSQKCPNVFWTCFGAFFLENFCPLFRGGSSLPKFSKKTKTFQSSKNAQKSSQNYPNVFWTWFAANFSKNFCPVFHGGSSLRNFFKKKPKTFKVPKKPNILPKVSKRVLNMFRGKFFQEKPLPSVQWRFETSKFGEKLKKSQKSKYAQNRSQKCPNVFWTCFGAIFLKSFIASVPWRLETSKIFEKNLKNVKFPKMFKIVRKSVQKCFGVIFSKKFYSECSMEGRVFENFKKYIYSKIQKGRKLFPKVSKRVLNMFWGKFFGKFLPIFRGVSSLPKFSKKLKKCQISKNVQNCSQKCPNVFWTCFGANFLENLCPVFHGGSSPLNFENSWKSLKNPKKPKIVPKSVQMCFEHVLGQFFWKVSWPVFHGGSRLPKLSKKT